MSGGSVVVNGGFQARVAVGVGIGLIIESSLRVDDGLQVLGIGIAEDRHFAVGGLIAVDKLLRGA